MQKECTCFQNLSDASHGLTNIKMIAICTTFLLPSPRSWLTKNLQNILLWNHGVLKLWCASNFNPHSIAPTPTTLQNLVCWWWRWQIMIHKRHHELVIQESRFKAHNIWCTYPNHQRQITQKSSVLILGMLVINVLICIHDLII